MQAFSQAAARTTGQGVNVLSFKTGRVAQEPIASRRVVSVPTNAHEILASIGRGGNRWAAVWQSG